MSRAPKFNFVPERQLFQAEVDPTYNVSIFKNGVIAFPTEVVKVFELDGKYAKFYADKEHRTIGWSVLEGSTQMLDLHEARQLKMSVNNNIIVSVKKILAYLGIPEGTTYSKLEVKTHKSSLNAHDIMYVELPLPEAKVTLTDSKK